MPAGSSRRLGVAVAAAVLLVTAARADFTPVSQSRCVSWTSQPGAGGLSCAADFGDFSQTIAPGGGGCSGILAGSASQDSVIGSDYMLISGSADGTVFGPDEPTSHIGSISSVFTVGFVLTEATTMTLVLDLQESDGADIFGGATVNFSAGPCPLEPPLVFGFQAPDQQTVIQTLDPGEYCLEVVVAVLTPDCTPGSSSSAGASCLVAMGFGDDADEDGIPDLSDNCPDLSNSMQADCDGDGIGDVCAIASGMSTDEDGNGIPDECGCAADVNGDFVINVTDLVEIILAWGPCAAPCAADINADGTVNVTDLIEVILAWGDCL